MRRRLPLVLLGVSVGSMLSAAEERPFPTIVAVGGAWPIESSEGLPSTIIHLDHQSTGYFASGSLNILLDTVELSLGMRHRAAPLWELGYRARGRKFIEGYGEDIYRDGDRLESQTFTGDSLAAGLLASLNPDGPWSSTLDLEAMAARFETTDETREGFNLPSSFQQQEVRWDIAYKGSMLADDGAGRLSLIAGRRNNWEAWSLEPDPERRTPYHKQELSLEQPVRFSAWQHTKWRLFALNGDDLDLFSAFRVGGYSGQYQVAGYYRNEFRARSAAVLNIEHEIAFAEDRKLSFFADGAWLRRADLTYLTDTPNMRNLVGLGIGYYYGVRELAGMPIIVRYGEGVRVPDESKEDHRRELLLIVAAGF